MFYIASFYPEENIPKRVNMPRDWRPQTAPLMTEWAGQVEPGHPHPEYPRPGLVRDTWISLNGLWDLQISGYINNMFSVLMLIPFVKEQQLRVSWFPSVLSLPCPG